MAFLGKSLPWTVLARPRQMLPDSILVIRGMVVDRELKSLRRTAAVLTSGDMRALEIWYLSPMASVANSGTLWPKYDDAV